MCTTTPRASWHLATASTTHVIIQTPQNPPSRSPPPRQARLSLAPSPSLPTPLTLQVLQGRQHRVWLECSSKLTAPTSEQKTPPLRTPFLGTQPPSQMAHTISKQSRETRQGIPPQPRGGA